MMQLKGCVRQLIHRKVLGIVSSYTVCFKPSTDRFFHLQMTNEHANLLNAAGCWWIWEPAYLFWRASVVFELRHGWLLLGRMNFICLEIIAQAYSCTMYKCFSTEISTLFNFGSRKATPWNCFSSRSSIAFWLLWQKRLRSYIIYIRVLHSSDKLFYLSWREMIITVSKFMTNTSNSGHVYHSYFLPCAAAFLRY